MKEQWDEGGGRILLDDDTGVGTVMLRQIKLHCDVWISAGLLCIQMYAIVGHMLLSSDLRRIFRNVIMA